MDQNYLQLLNFGFLFILTSVSWADITHRNLYIIPYTALLSMLAIVYSNFSNAQLTLTILFTVSTLCLLVLNYQFVKRAFYLSKIIYVLQQFTLCVLAVNQIAQSIFLLSLTIATVFLIVVLIVIYHTKTSNIKINNILVSVEYVCVSPLNDNEEELKETLACIHSWFEKTHCYLDSDYSLDQLEKDLNINRKYLSLSINKVAQKNFYQFIAFYRVKYAKEIILKDSRFTLETLSSECGFYSKSTFNKYFKKFEGQTPSVFKLSHT